MALFSPTFILYIELCILLHNFKTQVIILAKQRLPIIIVRAGGQEGVRKVRDALGGVVTTLRGGGEVADGRKAFGIRRRMKMWTCIIMDCK